MTAPINNIYLTDFYFPLLKIYNLIFMELLQEGRREPHAEEKWFDFGNETM